MEQPPHFPIGQLVSEAVLFLSATPVQLGSRNLFSLLNLLRPDLFPDEVVFDEMVAPNRHINRAMRHVRGRKPERHGKRRPHACWWRLRQRHGALVLSSTTRDSATACKDWRRRDISRFTIREPHTVSVPFTVAQEAFYRGLIAFRREVLLLKYDPLVIRLITDMLERQAVSSLPALVPALDTFLRTGRFSTSGLSDAQEEEEGEFELPEPLRRKAQGLRRLASQLPPDDPKMEALLGIARTARDGAGAGKLLVFSYFLHTLHYLAARLRSAGFRVGVVMGQVEDEERERIRDRFRVPASSPDALDILLSSEVGCEGLDYEFCDRMVNYDIPWNPMRLEQRIGRIDRFGQQSEKVLIFNFVTPGTVEERIFFRCFERLGIFRDTVGDCEEVLGEQAVAEQLLDLARDPRLTPEQAEVRAMQLADNAVRLVEEQRRLEEESASLLGYEQALTDEVNAIDAEGRFVSADEQRSIISLFVEQANLGGQPGARSGEPASFPTAPEQGGAGDAGKQLTQLAVGGSFRDRVSPLAGWQRAPTARYLRSACLLRLLSQGESVRLPSALLGQVIQEAISALDEQTHREREAALNELLIRNEQLVASVVSLK